MNLKPYNPKQALNKAYLKQKITRQDIESFKYNLGILLKKIDNEESEENAKNHLIAFMLNTYYNGKHEVNTKGRIDLVIHLDASPKSKAGVLIEAKRPVNKSEMITKDNLNAKAMQELILYYLQERIDENNIDIKYVAATNIYEWFIFDASVFDKLFYKNKALVRDYEDWRDGRKARTDTPLFYNDIAKPFLDNLNEDIEFTYFNFRDYIEIIENKCSDNDNQLVSLYKLLSPEHLLKQSFANDSNSLDPKFYSELLHIIGLEEVKEGSKKIIRRKKVGKRNQASLLENAINTIDIEDRLRKIKDLADYGEKQDDRLFNVALELCITWINRVLFLKLLEAQLLKYHSGNKKFKFLDIEKVPDYDELNKLFFQVLARKIDERSDSVQKKYSTVPYLNSSLFEMTSLEDDAIRINSLDNDIELDIISTTVLKDNSGFRKVKPMKALSYLFEFLDAYDFTSEGSDIIQEENKTLINASVLGLIFEKINGYKDGSIYTPGFITMFMSRESLRLAVVQKFKDECKIELENFNDLKVFTGRYYTTDKIKEFNNIVNNLKICDPAVGSGHFLVSCLNELIAIKSELGILAGEDNIPFNKWTAGVENDELILTDREGNIFEYARRDSGNIYINPEIQKIQKTLFNEKKTIIENCLFGVDINPNSVKICRLRLWIELLKNAYYTEESNFVELETLPNIDINIKCGNSLISRFPIDADLSKALKTIKWNINDYRVLVNEYKNTQDKEYKRGIEAMITDIKNNFRSEIGKSDPKVVRLEKLSSEYLDKFQSTRMFDTELSTKQKEAEKKARQKLEAEITKLSNEIDEIKNNAIYRNAFEWRFEFPEVLDDNGDFKGFDVLIGNPPYFSVSTMENNIQAAINRCGYHTFSKTTDIYALFIEKGIEILADKYNLTYITSNKWMRAGYGELLRNFITSKVSPYKLIDFGGYKVFDNVTVDVDILIIQKTLNKIVNFLACSIKSDFTSKTSIQEYFDLRKKTMLNSGKEPWIISSDIEDNIRLRIERLGKPLKNWELIINRGLTTGLNEAFIIDGKKKIELINDAPNSVEFIRPILRGRDIKKYQPDYSDLWLINIPKGFTIKSMLNIRKNIVSEPIPRYGYIEYEQAWQYIKDNYPAIAHHLIKYKSAATERQDQGDYWWELRACAYLEEFSKEKICFSKASKEQSFCLDENSSYLLNTSYYLIHPTSNLYLLSILNSKLARFCFLTYYQSGGIDGEITIQGIMEIPIPDITSEAQQPFIKIVEQILAIKKENLQADTSELEEETDRLVYELYGLTDEEIRIVEGR